MSRHIDDDCFAQAYRVLGVSFSAGPAAIKRRYRDMVRQWHPDLWPDRMDMATRRMHQIDNAYRLIRHAPLRGQESSGAAVRGGGRPAASYPDIAGAPGRWRPQRDLWGYPPYPREKEEAWRRANGLRRAAAERPVRRRDGVDLSNVFWLFLNFLLDVAQAVLSALVV